MADRLFSGIDNCWLGLRSDRERKRSGNKSPICAKTQESPISGLAYWIQHNNIDGTSLTPAQYEKYLNNLTNTNSVV